MIICCACRFKWRAFDSGHEGHKITNFHYDCVTFNQVNWYGYCCSGVLLTVTTYYLYVLFLLSVDYDVSFSIKEKNVEISDPRPGFGMGQLLDRFLW